MNTAELDQRLDEILRGNVPGLAGREITDDLNLANHGLNSLRSIAVLMAIEDGLGISFPDEAMVPATFGTRGALRQVVAELVGPCTADPHGQP